ncbi:DUF4397 domain-containing protein [Mucilaginibacter litoreus]|uniref:DUF4397 domain-containing protein n=1 Tax=Mucilaginibacter litoreus TaxID=1048221 RepID=A0ABW3ANT8_9SPHI
MKFKTFGFICLAIIAISSCKKGVDGVTETQTTSVNYINTTGDTLNVYANGSRINITNSIYPLGSSGYLNTPIGEQNYQVKKYGNPNVLFSLQMPLKEDNVYSFYLTGNSPDNVFTDVDTLKGVDTLTLIRFVHTSPNAGNVDVWVGDTVKFNGMAYKSTSQFMHIRPGIKRIRIYKAGCTTQLLSDETRTLIINRAYTLFTKSGLSADGGTTSGTGLVINK